jgi:hypothetical protein
MRRPIPVQRQQPQNQVRIAPLMFLPITELT